MASACTSRRHAERRRRRRGRRRLGCAAACCLVNETQQPGGCTPAARRTSVLACVPRALRTHGGPSRASAARRVTRWVCRRRQAESAVQGRWLHDPGCPRHAQGTRVPRQPTDAHGRTPYRVGSGRTEARPPNHLMAAHMPVRRYAAPHGRGDAADVRVATPPPHGFGNQRTASHTGPPRRAAGTFNNSHPRRAVGVVFVRRQRLLFRERWFSFCRPVSLVPRSPRRCVRVCVCVVCACDVSALGTQDPNARPGRAGWPD